HAPGDAARVLSSEVLVVVVACRELQVVPAEGALVLDEAGAVVAAGVEGVEAAADATAVARPVRTDRQQLAVAQGDVGLHAGAVAVGAEAVDHGAVKDVVGR